MSVLSSRSAGWATSPVALCGMKQHTLGTCRVGLTRGYAIGVTQGALASAPGGVHGFTVARTSFVGRVGEAAELSGLLAEYRLVTVTGPGGVGKTRLAVEVARQVQDRFADGAWLVELASVPDPALVTAAVAKADRSAAKHRPGGRPDRYRRAR